MSSNNWSTPQAFFDKLNKEFCFDLDVCAVPETAKCSDFFSPDDDGLSRDWSGKTIWMNPPYGRGVNVYDWVAKLVNTALQNPSNKAVALLPVSTDTRWFRELVIENACEIRFVIDRLWFSLDGLASRASHARMVVVFDGSRLNQRPVISMIPNERVRRATA